MCGGERSAQESILSYHVGPGEGSQIVKLGSKHIYLLTHLIMVEAFKVNIFLYFFLICLYEIIPGTILSSETMHDW